MVRTGTPHDTLAFDMLDLSVVDLFGWKEQRMTRLQCLFRVKQKVWSV